jgi:hypothetical protein
MTDPASPAQADPAALAAFDVLVPDVFPPLDYPSAPAPSAGLLGDGIFAPMRIAPGGPPSSALIRGGDGELRELDDELARLGAARVGERTAVLAVGSNAAPSVMLRKLRAHGASPLLPMAPVRVEGIVAGHSAHISPPGFIAATPFAVDPARSDPAEGKLVVGWLDEAQLAALDRTEPSYRRLRLAAARYPIRLVEGGHELAEADIYESLRGVLSIGGAPIALRSQPQLHSLLRSAMPALAALVELSDPHEAVALLADAGRRELIRTFWLDTGSVLESGLAGDPAG